MALQASGQIKISEVLTEGGQSATRANTSLSDLETGTVFTINTSSASKPNGLEPNALSEWYSYDHAGAPPAYSNSHYYDMTAASGNSLVRTASTSPFNLSTTQDLSISVWYRQDQTSASNQILWDFTNANNGNDRMFLQYNSSTNNFVVRMRTSSSNFGTEFNLVSNSSATGITSGSWIDTNRGNVVDGNFCLLTVTYDASQTTGSNAFKLYWNATECTTKTNTLSNSRTTRAVNHLVIGNNGHNYTTSAGAFDGGVDEMKVYTDILTSTEVSTIYNSGAIADATETHSEQLLTEITFDSDVSDSNGNFPTTTNNTGTRTVY